MNDLDKICVILNQYDLEGIGPRFHAYEPEAKVLLRRVVDRPLTAQYVRDVWLVFFASGDDATSMHEGRRTWVADMPMRPEFHKIALDVNNVFRPGTAAVQVVRDRLVEIFRDLIGETISPMIDCLAAANDLEALSAVLTKFERDAEPYYARAAEITKEAALFEAKLALKAKPAKV